MGKVGQAKVGRSAVQDGQRWCTPGWDPASWAGSACSGGFFLVLGGMSPILGSEGADCPLPSTRPGGDCL